ncbi:MAG: spore germination protein [Oscillospiraceae bacterium]|jgi:spore germination protein KB|nr:spore germination protein [Oscillospiraceae bacterium]
MQQRGLSARDAVCLLVVCTLGTSIASGLSLGLGRDSWLAVLIAIIPMAVLMLIYGSINKAMPNKDIFEIMELCLGKGLAKLTSIIFIAWFLIIAAQSAGVFARFIHLSSLTKTPLLAIVLLMLLPAIYMTKSGGQLLGKWAFVMLLAIAAILIFALAFSIPNMDFHKLLPIAQGSKRELLKGSAKLIASPLGEAAILLVMIGKVKEGRKPFKLFLIGGGISLLFLLITELRTLTILGAEMAANAQFAEYRANGVLKIGPFLQRIEALVEFVYVLSGMVKIAAFIWCGARGIAQTFKTTQKKSLWAGTAITAAALLPWLFMNDLQLEAINRMIRICALPIVTVLPLIVAVAALFKRKKHRQEQAAPGNLL